MNKMDVFKNLINNKLLKKVDEEASSRSDYSNSSELSEIFDN